LSNRPTFFNRRADWKVESNDSLYALSEPYVQELHNIVNSVLEKALSELHAIKQAENPILVQSLPDVSLELFNILIGHSSIDSSTSTLAGRLFNMASKCSNVDKKYLKASVEAVKFKALKQPVPFADFYQKLKANA